MKREDLSENSVTKRISEQNGVSLDTILQFREDYAQKRVTFLDFAKMKRHHPFYGFLPFCIDELEFVMFHANDDVVAWELLWTGTYEGEITKTWVEWCRGANLIYDIGAYTGLMSVLGALANPNATIHLVEPMDRTIERAKINIVVNGISRRVKLHNRAASNKNGTETILMTRNEDFLGTGNSVYNKGLPVIAEKLIQCVRIDEHLPDLCPDVVKIDVEGHERACLEGMIETLTRARPKLLLESWAHDREAVMALLHSLGYECSPFELGSECSPPEAAYPRVINYKCIPRPDWKA